MRQEKKKFHYAWLIFIGCCFLSAGGFALVFDVVGIYLDTVSESLDIDFDALTLWLGLESVAEFIIMPFAGKLFTSKRLNVWITVGALFVVAGTFGFSLCTQTFHFIICGTLIGCGMPFLFGLPQTTLIGNWFGQKYQGRMLSIAMAFEGIFAMIWAPLFMVFLQNVGWQMTYVINAVLIAVMILPWSIFVFCREPQDMGLLPYGVTENEADDEPEEEDSEVGSKVKTALKCPAFWCTLLAACVVTFGMGFQDYQPVIALEMLVPGAMDEASAEMFGATMISVFSAGSLIGTFLFGILMDKIGIKWTMGIYLVCFLVSFAFWGFAGTLAAALMVGAFTLGTHNGLASVGYPLLLRRLFGGLHYPQIYSYMNAVVTLLGGFTASIVGYVFGVLGSFEATILMLGFGLAIALVIFTLLALRYLGKVNWDDKEVMPSPANDEVSNA